MYEIIQHGIKYMKEEFGLHRIMANHMISNVRSEKLLMRLGFEKEGLAKSYLKINGKWQDHILNSLILPSK
jgi:ribosomal-protein-alanine N-acetyltransferase